MSDSSINGKAHRAKTQIVSQPAAGRAEPKIKAQSESLAPANLKEADWVGNAYEPKGSGGMLKAGVPFDPALDRPVAVVGGQVITDSKINERIESDLSEALHDFWQDIGQQLHIVAAQNELPAVYEARLRSEIAARELLPKIESLISQMRSKIATNAVYDLVGAGVMGEALRQRGISLTDVEKADSGQLWLRLLELTAAEKKKSPDDEKLKAELHDWVDAQIDTALWAPYQALAKQHFATFSETSRQNVLRWLGSQYVAEHGIRTPEAIAKDLVTGGPAAHVALLINDTQRGEWTLADFDRFKKKHAALTKAFSVPAHPGDELERALSSVTLSLAKGGWSFSVGAPPAVLKQLREGTVLLAWKESKEGMLLGLVDSAGKAIESSPEQVQVLSEVLERLDALVVRLRSPKTGAKSLIKLLEDSGLGSLSVQGTEWLFNSPQFKAALDKRAVDAAVAQTANSDFEVALKPLGLPADTVERATRTLVRTRALLTLQPMPTAFLDALSGRRPLKIPLTEGAVLTHEARAVVASLQRCLAAARLLKPLPVVPGTLDAASVALFKEQAGSPSASEVIIDAQRASEMLALLTPHLVPKEVFGAEEVLRFPAVQVALEKNAVLNPVDVALAYLTASGAALDPKALAPDQFFRALDNVSRQPVDVAALDVATNAVTRSPLSKSERETVLRFHAVRLEQGGDVAYLPTAALADTEAAVLAKRLSAAGESSAIRRIGRGEWSALTDKEPVVALKLAVAQLMRTPAPVGSDGHIAGYLTGTELRSLAPMVLGAAAIAGNPLFEQWRRVAEAIDVGRVVLSNLEPVAATGPLAVDVNAIIARLVQATVTLKMVSSPTDAASAATSLQKAPYRSLSGNRAPLGAARAVLAGASIVQSSNQLETLDFVRLRDFAVELEKKTPTEKGSELDYEARAFLERYKQAELLLNEVSVAVAHGELAIRENEVSSTNGDGFLVAKGVAARSLFMQCAEVRQSQARKANEGFVGGMQRSAIEVSHNLFRLPGFSDTLVFNSVNSWSLVALKAEIDQVLGQNNALPADQKGAKLLSVDAAVLNHLLRHHGSELGESVAASAIAGVGTGLPKNAQARELLSQLAAKMEDGPGWASLNVSLADDEPTRVGKALVQEALQRLYGRSELWGNLLPGRDAAAVDQLAHRMAGLEADQLAPMLKGAMVLSGHAKVAELGDFKSPQLSVAALRASAAMAESLAKELDNDSGELRERLTSAVEQLKAAAEKGPYTLGSSTQPVDKALRALAESAVSLTIDPGEMRNIDTHKQLPELKELVIRRPIENIVRDQAPEATLAWVVGNAGAIVPWSDELSARFERWKDHVVFDPTHAVETSLATYVQFFHLMHTMVSYDLSVAPISKTAQAAYAALHAQTPEEYDEAMARIGQTWSEWVNLQAMMSAYVTGVGFGQELTHLTESGKLDEAAGKAAVFSALLAGTMRTVGAVAGKVGEWRRRDETFSSTQISRNLAVPIGTSAMVETPSGSKVVAAQAYDVAARAGNILRTPKDLLLGTPVKGLRSALGAMGLTRSVRVDTAKGAFTGFLTEADRQWIENEPDGRLSLRLKGDGGVEQVLNVRNRDLCRLSQLENDRVPPELIKRLGLKGPKTKTLVSGLYKLSAGLQQKFAPSVLPSLETLVSPGKVRQTTRWAVQTGSGNQQLEIKNAALAELVDAQHRGPHAFDEALKRQGLTPYKESVQAIVDNYAIETPSKAQSAARKAWALDQKNEEKVHTVLTSPAAYLEDSTSRALFKATVEGVTYRVLRDAKGNFEVHAGAHDVTKTAFGAKIIAGLEATRTRYGTHNPALIAELKLIETGADNWRAKLAKGALTDNDRAAFTQWEKSTEAVFSTRLKSVDIATVKGRLRLELLKTQVWATGVESTLRAKGLAGVTVRIAESSGRTLSGVAKSSAFYAVIALEGPQLVLELGSVVGDEKLSTLQKSLLASTKTAGVVGNAAVGVGAFTVLERFFPAVAKLGSGLMGGAVTAMVVDGPDLVLRGLSKAKGQLSAADAIGRWAALGLPEASYYKLDPALYAKPLFFSNTGSDRNVIENESGQATVRHAYVKGTVDPKTRAYQHSTFTERIAQLTNTSGPFNETLIRTPQSFDPKQVKHFKEPLFPTWRFLQRFDTLSAAQPVLRDAQAAKGFGFGAWQAEVRKQADVAVTTFEQEGVQKFVVKADALKALFAANDIYAGLKPAQKDAMERRLAQSVVSTQNWIGVINTLAIPNEEKQAAVLQFVENVAADHRANSMMFETLTKNPRLARRELTAQLSAEHTPDDYFIGVLNFVEKNG